MGNAPPMGAFPLLPNMLNTKCCTLSNLDRPTSKDIDLADDRFLVKQQNTLKQVPPTLEAPTSLNSHKTLVQIVAICAIKDC